jgi:methyltransferase-like protein
VADVTKLGDLGQFDYIVVHGLFSWVPKSVQPGIVETCSRMLAPQGVAYISYNAYPGWHMRETTRRIVLQQIVGCKTPEELQRRAVALCQTISRAREETPIWRDFMKAEAERLLEKAPVDCFHDDFDEHNNPVYFRDFARLAEASGLRYLGESDLKDSAHPSGLPPEAQTDMDDCGIEDRIEREQFLDMLMTRMFRRTMLCHADVEFDHRFHPKALQSCYFSSPMRPPALTAESIRSEEKLRFEWQGLGATVSDPFVKATFFELAKAWPGSITFDDLVSRLRSWVPDQADPAGTLTQILIQLPLGKALDIRPTPWPWADSISERPVVSRQARIQAQHGIEVTSLRHNGIRLDNPLAVQMVKALDGTHHRSELPELLGAQGPVVEAAMERLRHYGLLES